MTVQKLLLDCDFDEVAPYIRSLFSDDQAYVRWLYLYKEVFDRLRHTEPVHSDEVVNVCWCSEDGEPDSPEDSVVGDVDECETYISVENCEGDLFESNLGKEIVVADDVLISKEELAARVLWSMTYYGFSDEDQKIVFSEKGHLPITKYRVRANTLQRRYYMRLLPKECRSEKEELRKSGLIAFPMEIWELIREREAGRKGKRRKLRMEKRVDRLGFKDFVEDIIRKLTEAPTSPCFKRSDLKFLFRADAIDCLDFHSYAYDHRERMSYIAELVEKYMVDPPWHWSKYTGLLIHARTSPDHPVETWEWAELRQLAGQLFPQCHIVRCGAGLAPSIGDEIAVRIVYYH